MGPYKTRFHFGQSYAKMIPICKYVANAWPMCCQSCAKIKPACQGVANVMPQVSHHTDMLRFRHCYHGLPKLCQSAVAITPICQGVAKVWPIVWQSCASTMPKSSRLAKFLPTLCRSYGKIIPACSSIAWRGQCFAKIVPK